MEIASVWAYVHILLLVFWLGTDIGALAAFGLAKRPERAFETRRAYIDLAQKLHLLPRICFALMLPTGVELTQAINVYPVNPELRASLWVVSLAWLAVIFAAARHRGTPLAKHLSYAEIAFEALAGMGFVAYGLNSLATGSPIDDGWFAAKLCLFGGVFWAAIAVELSFHPFVVPFAEIGEEGPTFEREESVSRALNNTMKAMVFMYLLLATIAFLGKIKPV